jgi:hypothetical protein
MTQKQTQPNGGVAPDYAHWVQVPAWTREEAIALSVGLNPDVIDPGAMTELAQDSDAGKRSRLLMRGFEFGVFANSIRISPEDFLSWMKSNRLDVPKALIAAAKAQGHALTDWRREYDALKARTDAEDAKRALEKPTNRPEPQFTSLYTIILGVAYGRHGYDPGAKRNAAPAAIVGEVEQAGLTISAETVLNILRTACEYLDYDPMQSGR